MSNSSDALNRASPSLRGMHAPELRHLQPLYQRYAAQPALLAELERRFALCQVDPADVRTQSPELALQLNEYLYEQGDWHAMAWLANELDMGAGGGLVYFLRSAQTVGQAMTELVRLGPMLFPDGGVELIVEPHAWQLRLYPVVHAERLGMILRYEAICCWLVKVMQHLQGLPVLPLTVGLMSFDRGSRDLQLYLGKSIRWGEATFALSWPAALWHAQLPSASAPLFSSLRVHFTQYLDTVLASDTLAQQTCRYLLQKQRLACAQLPDVARALHLTVAQYRRQLAAEQTSFSRIQLELKRVQAVRRLLSSQERVEVLAQELGFTERSAFERAFNHWYACTPSQFRRELQRHFTVLDFPSWESPHAWPFPLYRQAALQVALEAPELDRSELVAIWALNPKLCALLLAELNQPECGALSCDQLASGLTILRPDLIKSLWYAAMSNKEIDSAGNASLDFNACRLSYFLHQVCLAIKLDPHGALSANWASFFCLLAGGEPNMNLAYYSQRAAILLASWGVPHAIVRRLFLWGAEKSDEYSYLNAALTWAQQVDAAPADACWPSLWQQTLDALAD